MIEGRLSDARDSHVKQQIGGFAAHCRREINDLSRGEQEAATRQNLDRVGECVAGHCARGWVSDETRRHKDTYRDESVCTWNHQDCTKSGENCLKFQNSSAKRGESALIWMGLGA